MSPGAEYDRLVDAIARDLADIRDADTGAPVVDNVVKTRHVYSGPAAATLPDIFVNWRRKRPFYRITSPKIGVIEIPDRNRTGDHTYDGAFWGPRSRMARFRPGQTVRPHEITDLIYYSARREPALATSPIV